MLTEMPFPMGMESDFSVVGEYLLFNYILAFLRVFELFDDI